MRSFKGHANSMISIRYRASYFVNIYPFQGNPRIKKLFAWTKHTQYDVRKMAAASEVWLWQHYHVRSLPSHRKYTNFLQHQNHNLDLLEDRIMNATPSLYEYPYPEEF